MPNDIFSENENLLTKYGEPIARYIGEGFLTLEGGREIPCDFEAGQLKKGKVLLICQLHLSKVEFFFEYLRSGYRAATFVGTTSDGEKIISIGPILSVANIGEDTEEKTGEAYLLQELHVQLHQESTATIVHFGVTNFEFAATAILVTGKTNLSDLRFEIQVAGEARSFLVRPVPNYKTIIKRVQATKGIEVTCEVIGNVFPNETIEQLTDTINDLCYLLSVARGTKIQWIYRDEYDEKGDCIARTHATTVTKQYCPLAVIDPESATETKRFLEQTYPVYVSKRGDYRLNRGIIDAYLDAKAENDYLETRAVKLGVAMEMIKAVFLEASGSDVKEYILDEPIFENLIPDIAKAVDAVVEQNGIGGVLRNALCSPGKIRSLNRRSFGHVMTKLFGDIELVVTRKDLNLFIESRNKLVHKGRFYYSVATPEEEAKVSCPASVAEEYGFLLNFLDRIFLKLLGYAGPYICWRSLTKPRRMTMHDNQRDS